MLEDRLQALVTGGSEVQRPATGRFQPPFSIALAQAHDAQTGVEGLLGEGAALQHRPDQGLGMGSAVPGPAQKPLRGPLELALVALGHVLLERLVVARGVTAPMRGNALALVEDFDGACAQAHLHFLLHQHVGHRVVALGNADVNVGRDPRLEPLGQFVALRRQRLERRAVQGLELGTARAGQLLEGLVVERHEQALDLSVELAEAEELVVAQPCQNPLLDPLHAIFGDCLIFRLPDPRRYDCDPIEAGHVRVAAVQIRVVAVGPGDRRLQVVGDQNFGTTPKEREGTDVRADPLLYLLRPGGLGIGVVARPQHRHEDLCLAHLPAVTVDDTDRLAGIVDEQLLAGRVALAHDHVQRAHPLAIKVGELAVLIATLGVLLLVLLPQQRQRHAFALHLLVDVGPIGCCPMAVAGQLRLAKQPLFQLRFRQSLGQWPADPRLLGSLQIIGDCRARDAQARGDLAVAQIGGEFEA
jgi:hypothetical protein